MIRSLLSTRHDCQAFAEYLAFGSRTPKPILSWRVPEAAPRRYSGRQEQRTDFLMATACPGNLKSQIATSST